METVEKSEMEFDPAAGRYIPPPVLGVDVAKVPNDSGMREEPPSEVAGGWNWGAFYLNWIWLIKHDREWWSIGLIAVCALPYLIALTPLAPLFGPVLLIAVIAQFVIFVQLGLKGNEIAWRFRRFESIEDFLACQRSWTRWSVRVFLMSTLAIFLLFTWLMGIWR